jgi:hypothetical protein
MTMSTEGAVTGAKDGARSHQAADWMEAGA